MTVQFPWYLLVVILSMTLADVVAAQELGPSAPAPPSTGDHYLDMRKSEDRVIQRFAERYYNLVKLQVWTSANNKSTVNAKYVDHDPDLKWVKLATVRGSGANRVVKEVTVPVDKLNKTCQSRVRQIATLQMKLDELAAESEEDPAGGETGYGEYGRGEYGAPMTDERGQQPPANYGEEAADAAAGEYAAQPGIPAAGPPMPVIDPNDSDPLGFAEVANQAPAGAALETRRYSGYSGYGVTPPGNGEAPAGAASGAAWTRDYAAFHANFTPAQDERGGPSVDWGELADLRQMNESVAATSPDGQPADPYRTQVSEIAQRLPEVNWTAQFAGLDQSEGAAPEARFNLPQLPEPLKIRFVVDRPDALSAWAQLRPRQQVRFTGRLDIGQPNEIIVHLGMVELVGPQNAPTEPPPRR